MAQETAAILNGTELKVDDELTLVSNGVSYSSLSAAVSSGEKIIGIKKGEYSFEPNETTTDDTTDTINLDVSGKTIYGESGAVISGGSISVTAERQGGAAFRITSGTTLLSGLTFGNNYVNKQSSSVSGSYMGGAIYVANASTTGTLENIVFSGNTTDTCGGALLVVDGSGVFNVKNSLFDKNIANHGGAARFNGEARFNFYGSTFTNNIATSGGGALSLNSGNTPVYVGSDADGKKSEFISNTATNGAAIHVNDGCINIDGAIFKNNVATNKGTVLIDMHAQTDCVIRNAEFTENTAANMGAAICVTGMVCGKKVTIGNIVFNGNSVTAGRSMGGALYLQKSSKSNVDYGAFVEIDGLLTLKTQYDTIKISDTLSTITVLGEKFLTETNGKTFAKVVEAEFTEKWLYGEIGANNGYQTFMADNDLYVTTEDYTYRSDAALIKSNATDGELISANIRGEKVITVGYDTLKDAVNDSKKIIYVEAGEYTHSHVNVSGCTITGAAGAVFTGGNYSTGTRYDGGASLNVTGGTNLISGITFTNNTLDRTASSYVGGAAINIRATAEISDCIFRENVSNYNGGAVYANANSNVTIYDSWFDKNYSSRGGGYDIQKDSTLYGATFTGNTAYSSGGGGVYIAGGALTLNASNNRLTEFSNNLAIGAKGGAVYAQDGAVYIDKAVFTGNTANNGGAIYIDVNAPELWSKIENTYFSGNSATGNGGALYINGGSVTISGCTFQTARDTIYATKASASGVSYGYLRFTGTNFFNATIKAASSIQIDAIDSVSVFGNTAAIDVAGMTFSGTSALNFKGEQVNFKASGGQTFDGTITVDASLLQKSGTYVIATGLKLADTQTITVDGVNYGFGELIDMGETVKTISYSGNTLSVADAAPVKAILDDDFTGTTDVIMEIGGKKYLVCQTNSLADALAYNDITVKNGSYATDSRDRIENKTFTGEEGATITGMGITAKNITLENITFDQCTEFNSNGGALYISDGTNTITNSLFTGNSMSAGKGGAIYINAGTTIISDTDFVNNARTAVYVYSGTVFLTNVTFSANSGDAFVMDGNTEYNATVNLNNVTFDKYVTLRKTITIDGNVTFQSGVNYYCTEAATVNADIIFDDTLTVYHDIGDFNFGENGGLCFNSGTVTFSKHGSSGNMDLSEKDFTLTVSADLLKSAASGTIAKGLYLADTQTVTIGDTTYSFGQQISLTDDEKAVVSYNADNGELTWQTSITTYRFVNVDCSGEKSKTVSEDGTTITLTGTPASEALRYTSDITEKVTVSNLDSAITANGFDLEVNNSTLETATVGAANGNVTIDLKNVTLDADKIELQNNGDLTGLTVNIENATRNDGNFSSITGCFNKNTVDGNVALSIKNTDVINSVIAVNNATVNGVISLTLDDCTVNNGVNVSNASPDAVMCQGMVVTVKDTTITNNLICGNGDKETTIDGDITVNLEGVTVAAVRPTNGNMVTGDIVVNMKNSTLYSLSNSGVDKGIQQLNVTGGENSITNYSSSLENISVADNASLHINKLYAYNTVVTLGENAAITMNELEFDSGTSISFNTAQDLSGVTITIATGDITTDVITVATGVSSVGSVTLTGDNKDLFEVVTDGNTLGYKLINNVSSGEQFVGTGVNAMTDSSVVLTKTFVGTAASNGDVTSVISAGTVNSAVVGGALLRSGSAALGTVSLTIAGGTLVGGSANGGMHYVAGYAYGDGQALPESANYTVEKAVLNLVGENTSVSANIFAGAHANQYAYTKVDATEVNVADGSYGRLYGGGWAQKGGKSEVGSATVTVSGGKVEYIYAGGGNSGGETITGSAVITITGSGAVDYVFLGGRYDSSRVTGDVTLTLSGEAKTLIRVSGHNGYPVDLTDGLTSMNVETNVSLGYLDYVEKVVISENNTLNISELLLLEDSGMSVDLNLGENGTFDPVENNSWVVMSGNALNETLVNSITFQIGKNALDFGSADADGFGLSWDEEKKAVKYGKLV